MVLRYITRWSGISLLLFGAIFMPLSGVITGCILFMYYLPAYVVVLYSFCILFLKFFNVFARNYVAQKKTAQLYHSFNRVATILLTKWIPDCSGYPWTAWYYSNPIPIVNRSPGSSRDGARPRLKPRWSEPSRVGFLFQPRCDAACRGNPPWLPRLAG